VALGRRKRERKLLGARQRPGDGDGPREAGRFSPPRKTETIPRMLHGEPLDSPARETAATLATWREGFLAGGQAARRVQSIGSLSSTFITNQ
jgi:hypothetical protein